MKRVLVTGGAGYTGSVLVERLLAEGLSVTVLDRMVYGGDHLPAHAALTIIAGDVRDTALVERTAAGHDAVFHLAFVSNDPKYELDPRIGHEINWLAFTPLVDAVRRAGVRRFIFPSSCSVYGAVPGATLVDETSPPAPLTDYARVKIACEQALFERQDERFCVVVLRPATVCGVSPRQRLDLTINRMVTQAVFGRAIKVQNPQTIRPGIHIEDLAELYVASLGWPAERVRSQTFNAAFENLTVRQSAELIRGIVGQDVALSEETATDARSYRVSSDKLARCFGYAPRRRTIDAVRALCEAFSGQRLSDPVTNPRYYNMRVEKQHDWRLRP